MIVTGLAGGQSLGQSMSLRATVSGPAWSELAMPGS